MGTVYVARRTFMPDANGFVAIKRLNRHAADNDAVRAFLREAAVTAMLHHPNIVATYQLGEHDGLPFIVMQLIQNVSLARLMQRLAERQEPLAPDYAARIIAQAATGLHAAHELSLQTSVLQSLPTLTVQPPRGPSRGSSGTCRRNRPRAVPWIVARTFSL